jgi:hypothetical protein
MKKIILLAIISVLMASCTKSLKMEKSYLQFAGAAKYTVEYTIPDNDGDPVYKTENHELLIAHDPKKITFDAQDGFVPEVKIYNINRTVPVPIIVSYYHNEVLIFKKEF